MSKFILLLFIATACSLSNAAPVDKRFVKEQQAVLWELKRLQKSKPEQEIKTAWAKKDFK